MTDFRDNFDDDLDDDLDDDFSAFRDDLFSDDEGSTAVVEDLPPLDDIDDEFDNLRRKSTRGESLDDDLDGDEEFFSDESSSGSRFAWKNFSPGQRLILALLVLLNIIIGTIGLLVVTGNLG
ncbi:MAG: hypothetical protein GY805_36775 [Chloroflexi bacterium]|nr:hypothetical protein [Chloroflexota bacterium]